MTGVSYLACGLFSGSSGVHGPLRYGPTSPLVVLQPRSLAGFFAPHGFLMQPGMQNHNDVCKGPSDCILLIHQRTKGDFIPAKTQ